MGYKVEIRPGAVRTLRKIQHPDLKRIARKIDSLAKNPRPHGAKKLAGPENLYRARAGNYRIVYQIRDKAHVVTVARIAHRRDVYRKLDK